MERPAHGRELDYVSKAGQRRKEVVIHDFLVQRLVVREMPVAFIRKAFEFIAVMPIVEEAFDIQMPVPLVFFENIEHGLKQNLTQSSRAAFGDQTGLRIKVT